jgi:hypothetical protein
MPELHESSSDSEEPREGRAVMVEFTKLKLMLMKSEPDVHFIRCCKEGMVLVDSVDDTLGARVSKNSLLKPEFPTALQWRFELKGVENPDVLLSFEIQRDRVHRKLKMCQTGYCGRLQCEPAKANAKAKVEIGINVMVNLMTMSLLMVLPKIPSLNGDQSEGDSKMCAIT